MKKGFTLAEVLITLLIIGVIAALTIPSFLSIYEQHQFKTGLRKALNSLNNSIAANILFEEETPLSNTDLFRYLIRHMNVINTKQYVNPYLGTGSNSAFYTADGIRYEFRWGVSKSNKKLHEADVYACMAKAEAAHQDWGCMGCGSYGLDKNPNNTSKPPCYILVDVNGDKKPTDPNPRKNATATYYYNPDNDINSNVVGDVFLIMITEQGAVPFGTIAQRAMYGK